MVLKHQTTNYMFLLSSPNSCIKCSKTILIQIDNSLLFLFINQPTVSDLYKTQFKWIWGGGRRFTVVHLRDDMEVTANHFNKHTIDIIQI